MWGEGEKKGGEERGTKGGEGEKKGGGEGRNRRKRGKRVHLLVRSLLLFAPVAKLDDKHNLNLNAHKSNSTTHFYHISVSAASTVLLNRGKRDFQSSR